MKHVLPPAILKAAVILLLLLWSPQSVLLGYQRPKRLGKTQPQTSTDSSFRPADVSKLAVVVVGNARSPAQSDAQRRVEDAFVQILIQKGYNLAARSDLQSVMKEKSFEQSGLTEDNAAALGKLLNVPAVLVLRITDNVTEAQRDPRSGMRAWVGRATLGARLVGVESGAIWWTGKLNRSEVVRDQGGHAFVLTEVARDLALAFPTRGPSEGGSDARSFDPKALEKLAVVVVGRGPARGDVQNDQQRLVEDEFVQVLIGKGYSLVSRSDIASVVKEQQFQQSGLTEDNAAELGKLLNVSAVLVLRINECTATSQFAAKVRRQVLVGRATLGARLVSVESGQIWWTRSFTGTRVIGSKGEVNRVLAMVANNVASAFPAKNGANVKPGSKSASKVTSG
jgi:hypothetical protein